MALDRSKTGRKKGTPNKATQSLMDKCAQLGADPFEILLHFATGNWKALGYPSKTRDKILGKEIVEEDVISSELRAKCAKEVCEYIHPKRRAIEVSGDAEGQGFRVIVEDYSKK